MAEHSSSFALRPVVQKAFPAEVRLPFVPEVQLADQGPYLKSHPEADSVDETSSASLNLGNKTKVRGQQSATNELSPISKLRPLPEKGRWESSHSGRLSHLKPLA